VKRTLIHNLDKRTSTMCQERQDLFNEFSSLRRDLQFNGYPQGFIYNTWLLAARSSEQRRKPLSSLHIPYVKGVLENLKRTGNRYDIRTILRTKHTLRVKPGRKEIRNRQHSLWMLQKLRLGNRPLTLRLRGHRHNIKACLLEKSELAQHSYEGGHTVNRDEARILGLESNSRYRKYKE
jgi:hypothetical protein